MTYSAANPMLTLRLPTNQRRQINYRLAQINRERRAAGQPKLSREHFFRELLTAAGMPDQPLTAEQESDLNRPTPAAPPKPRPGSLPVAHANHHRDRLPVAHRKRK